MNHAHTVNISGTVLKLILKLGNQKSSESLKLKNNTFNGQVQKLQSTEM